MLLVDDHQVIPAEIADQPRRRVNGQAGAAHDQHIRPADGAHRTLNGGFVQALLIQDHIRFYNAAAVRAAGHTVPLAAGFLDKADGVELAAAGAVVAQGGTVQLIHGFTARCLVQAVNILGDNGF